MSSSMPYRPRALIHRRSKRQLPNSCSSLHPLPSLSTIMASRTRSGAFGRPPSLKRGSKTDSSTLRVTSRKKTLCQEVGSSSIDVLRSDRWAPRARNISICGGSVFLNILKDTDLACFCLNKNNVILSLKETFRSGLNVHGDLFPIGQDKILVVPEFFNYTEDIIPSTGVHTDNMIFQFEQYLLYFEAGQNSLQQNGDLYSTYRNAQHLLRIYKDIVPQSGLIMVFQFWNVIIRAGTP